MNKTLKELNFDTDKNPLGRLSVDAIKKGFMSSTHRATHTAGGCTVALVCCAAS